MIGSFSNGVKQVLAKIALANFTNPAGLEKAGGSRYVATANSGGVQLGGAGDPGIGTLPPARWKCPTWTSPRNSPT